MLHLRIFLLFFPAVGSIDFAMETERLKEILKGTKIVVSPGLEVPLRDGDFSMELNLNLTFLCESRLLFSSNVQLPHIQKLNFMEYKPTVHDVVHTLSIMHIKNMPLKHFHFL